MGDTATMVTATLWLRMDLHSSGYTNFAFIADICDLCDREPWLSINPETGETSLQTIVTFVEAIPAEERGSVVTAKIDLPHPLSLGRVSEYLHYCAQLNHRLEALLAMRDVNAELHFYTVCDSTMHQALHDGRHTH